MKLGLKGDIYSEQLFNRLSHNPDILELFLREEDILGPARARLEAVIRSCQASGIKVFLHSPLVREGRGSSLAAGSAERRAYCNFSLEVMTTIAKRYNVNCVIHPSIVGVHDASEQELSDSLAHFTNESDNLFLWKNSVESFDFSIGSLSEEVISELDLPLCFDISHGFISSEGSNDELIQLLEKHKERIKYFHLVDSLGSSHDSLEVGKGKIEWGSVKPHLLNKPYVYDVNLRNQAYADEQLRSHDFLMNV